MKIKSYHYKYHEDIELTVPKAIENDYKDYLKFDPSWVGKHAKGKPDDAFNDWWLDERHSYNGEEDDLLITSKEIAEFIIDMEDFNSVEYKKFSSGGYRYTIYFCVDILEDGEGTIFTWIFGYKEAIEQSKQLEDATIGKLETELE